MAAFIGLTFARNMYISEILLRIDNTVAISYINRMGGIQYPHLNGITRNIWEWCEESRLFSFASYIKSKDNVEDFFAEPEIDLFATRLNAKCSTYVSWNRDPTAFNVDAFTIDWSSYFFYAFPSCFVDIKESSKNN